MSKNRLNYFYKINIKIKGGDPSAGSPTDTL